MQKRIVTINCTIAAIILIATYTFDTTLNLGEFDGLVFLLYSAYGIGAQLVVNIIAAIIYTTRQERIKAHGCWLSSGLLVLLLLLLRAIPAIAV